MKFVENFAFFRGYPPALNNIVPQGTMTTFYSDKGGGTLRLQKQPSTLLRAYVPDFWYSAPPPLMGLHIE